MIHSFYHSIFNYTHFTFLLVHCPYSYPVLNLTPLEHVLYTIFFKYSNASKYSNTRTSLFVYEQSARVSFLSNKYKYITRIERHTEREVQFVADTNIGLKENIESSNMKIQIIRRGKNVMHTHGRGSERERERKRDREGES